MEAPVSPHGIYYKMFLLSDPAVLLKRVLDHLSNLLNGGTFLDGGLGRGWFLLTEAQFVFTEALVGGSFSSRMRW